MINFPAQRHISRFFLKDEQPKQQPGLTERHLSGYVPFTPPESPCCPHRGVQGKNALRDIFILYYCYL